MKTCRVCGSSFEPVFSSLQKVCTVACSIADAKITNRKAFKQETRRRKKALNEESKSYQLKKCQEIFNRYIRSRDEKLPCISCNRHHEGQYHAGHYRTVGSTQGLGLRFNELNCFKQCAPCNNHLSGNIVEYRINLIKRIGEAKLNWLEGPHEIHKYTIDDIKEIKIYYKEKLSELSG